MKLIASARRIGSAAASDGALRPENAQGCSDFCPSFWLLFMSGLAMPGSAIDIIFIGPVPEHITTLIVPPDVSSMKPVGTTILSDSANITSKAASQRCFFR